MVEIYALCCPITGEVRYVGKANNSAQRLKSHIRDARRRKSPLYSWIRSLDDSGMLPVLKIIEIVPEESWIEREIYWIAKFRSSNTEKLLNLADGGEQPQCDHETRVRNGSRTAAVRPKYIMRAYRLLEWNIKMSRKSFPHLTPKLLLGYEKFRQSVNRHRGNGTLHVLDAALKERIFADRPATEWKWVDRQSDPIR